MGLLDLFRPTTNATRTPTAIDMALQSQGMGQAVDSLGPGRPVTPSRGYSVAPRANDFPVGVNMATNGRQAWGRTSFEIIRELINSYDVARACINHKIDEIRSMEPLFVPMDGAQGDTKLAVEAARAALAYPDREHTFDEWLALWLSDQYSFDAGVLYRRRNRDGQVIGLEVVDGTTIHPLIDGYGRRPKAPAPAYEQIIKGQANTWFTAQDMEYIRFRPQTNSPYGLSALESVMLTVNTDLRFQWHLLQMFTEGSIPAGFMEVPPDVSNPDQVAEWQDYWDGTFMGDQSIKHKLIAVPSGSNFTGTVPDKFDQTFPDFLARKMAMAYGVVAQDIGLLADVNRATGETQTDVQFRVNTLPSVRMVEGVLTRYLQRDLGLPVKLNLNTGRDKEDRLQEAQAWKIYTEAGFASVDEAREELLGLPGDATRPVPRFVLSARQGPIPLQSILAISGTIDPETKAPAADVPLSEVPFEGTPGLLSDKLPGGAEFKRAPINPDEPAFPALEHEHPGTAVVAPPAVAKEATAGITSATGLQGIDQLGHTTEPDDEDTDSSDEARRELAKFKAFTKTRAKVGKWRDFEFTTITKAVADHLNDTARADFAKAEPDPEPDTTARADPKAGTPSWRDTPPVKAPQHSVDLPLTDYWTPRVRDSIMALWSEQDLAATLDLVTPGELGPAALAAYRQAARESLLARMTPDQLNETVLRAWADAYNVGAMAAQVQIGNIPTGWDTWKPGITNPADITGNGGWVQALADSGHTVKGITDTTLDRLGTAIERGLIAGDTVDTIARDMRDYLGDNARAELIAHTETARMMTNAAMNEYRTYGLTQWDLVVSAGVCPTCLDIAAANPHSIADTGDQPPIHPRCRCAASPHIEPGGTP